jgi:cytoskeletal protein CcmA (bactofilin family)
LRPEQGLDLFSRCLLKTNPITFKEITCQGFIEKAKKGKICANVYARKVIVEGEINGNIESAEYVELKSAGRLIGNLKAAKIRMVPGCYFDGEVTMQR